MGWHVAYPLKLLSQFEHGVDVQLFVKHAPRSPKCSFRLVGILLVSSLKTLLQVIFVFGLRRQQLLRQGLFISARLIAQNQAGSLAAPEAKLAVHLPEIGMRKGMRL